MNETPTFAVVGAVNHGKSSVISTLAENDQVRVSAMPGETVDCQRFSLGELFVFFDTPGFQNAREALAELRAAAQAREPLALFADFVARHRGEPDFDAECRLFEPVVGGAGIVYVVDGSRPLLDLHLAEMELLRLTGAPRMALINRTGRDDHVADWKRRLGMHFNAVRQFDAHHASFADRIELLETLAGIEQGWKPRLMQAVAVLRQDWAGRLDEAAELIVQLLADVLQHRETAPPAEGPEAEAVAEQLRQRFMAAIAAREARAHAALIALFGHRRVKAGAATEPLFADGLFSEDTWSLLGLDARQLLAAGAAAGAVVGAGADAMTAGATLLAGSAIGAAVGAAGALMLGKRRPEIAVRLPRGPLPEPLSMLLPSQLRLGGASLVVGPYAAPNFPWIVLDRAVGTLAYVMHRAHARRDEVTLGAGQLQSLLADTGLASAQWPEAARRSCEQAFARLRRDRLEPQDREALRAAIRAQIDRLGERRPDAPG
ncbi:GTPase/DUF3482 domain-containing protein [Caldimonas tepidiphila]|uniref:GTPase/DUF3482 domain-containing protein n=1 Tax=Caldimonas tepidiphila TaxID=2315841 RepID=UPI000E5A55DD|nr:GTPase/DUF3482 domain-containing protein [Caldimonas tepidiphila]